MLTRVFRMAAVAAVVLGVLMPDGAFAKAPKKYQVTGKVLEINDETIIVQKDDEKWEIAKEAATKTEGTLKVGSKVTIEYTMTAATVTVKDDKPADKKK